MNRIILSIVALLVYAGGPWAQAEIPHTAARHAALTTPVAVVHERAGFVEETVLRTVWIPGSFQAVWISPKIETYIDDAGNQRQKLIRNGYYTNQWVPGRVEAIPVLRQYRLPSHAVERNPRRKPHVHARTQTITPPFKSASSWLY